MGDVKTGHLNQLITIRQTASTTVDASGSPITTTTDLGPIFAGVEFRTSGSDEENIGNQNTAVTSVRFTIRNNPERSIWADDQVIYRGKKYEIRSVLEADPKRCFLILETDQMGKEQTS